MLTTKQWVKVTAHFPLKQIQVGQFTLFSYNAIRSKKTKPEKVTFFSCFSLVNKIGRRISNIAWVPIVGFCTTWYVSSNERKKLIGVLPKMTQCSLLKKKHTHLLGPLQIACRDVTLPDSPVFRVGISSQDFEAGFRVRIGIHRGYVNLEVHTIHFQFNGLVLYSYIPGRFCLKALRCHDNQYHCFIYIWWVKRNDL